MSENNNFISVKIKVGTNPNDLKLTINVNDSLRSLKDTIKTELNCSEKYVRLICSGKLLEPDSTPLSKLGLVDGSFIHAVISTREPQSSSSSAASSASSLSNQTATPPREYRGFDRLTELGLTIDETAALRSSFQSQLTDFAAGYPQRADEDAHSYQFRIEDAWMREQGPASEFRLNLPRSASSAAAASGLHSNRFIGSIPSFQTIRSVAETSIYEEDTLHSSSGTMKEFIWGVLLGSTLGFLMIFCVWDRNISQKQKIGIMIGITIHMFTGYLQNTTTVTPNHSQALRGSHSISSSSSSSKDSSLGNGSNESIEYSLEVPAAGR